MSCAVLPVDDIEPHDEFSSTCKCAPRVEFINGEILIIHNAFDNREIIEKVNEILNNRKEK